MIYIDHKGAKGEYIMVIFLHHFFKKRTCELLAVQKLFIIINVAATEEKDLECADVFDIHLHGEGESHLGGRQ
jgi:hypothetical protein